MQLSHFFRLDIIGILACDKTVQCANSMITVIKNGINPILSQYDYPDLGVKIGIDEGENVIKTVWKRQKFID